MAENKHTGNSGAVDQGKVKSEAEALAKPNAQTKPITTDSPSDAAANSLVTGPVRGPEKARVEEISEEEAERRLDEQRQKEYGPGYVRASKQVEGGQGKLETTFSARAWDLLGSNKEGWKPVVKEPAEVTKLKSKQAEGEK